VTDTDTDLEALLERLRTWPSEWRAHAAGSLRSIEQMMTGEGGKYLMTEEEGADLRAAMLETDEASDDEIVAAFGRPFR
jgi:hypothetical protein